MGMSIRIPPEFITKTQALLKIRACATKRSTRFVELMPLLAGLTVLITVAKVDDKPVAQSDGAATKK
jgi:hypothetical protein